MMGGSNLTFPINSYKGIYNLDAKLIINFNDLYYHIGCFIEDDNITGGSWYCLSDDSHMDDVIGWTFNLDGTLVIEWG